MKKIFFCLLLITIIILSSQIEVKASERINVEIKSSINRYINLETYNLIENFKTEADKLIFNHPLNPETLSGFVNKYYKDVKYENTFKKDIESYLIKSSNVNDFIIEANYEIEIHITKLYDNILNNLIKEGTIEVKINLKNDYTSILEKDLPTAKDMVDDIWKDIVIGKHNKEYESELREIYREFKDKHPKSTMTIEAFCVISTSILAFYTGGASAAAGAGIFTIIIIDLETTNYREKEKLEKTLRSSILDRRNDFHTSIEKTTKKITRYMTNKLNDIIKNIKFKPDAKFNLDKM